MVGPSLEERLNSVVMKLGSFGHQYSPQVLLPAGFHIEKERAREIRNWKHTMTAGPKGAFAGRVLKIGCENEY